MTGFVYAISNSRGAVKIGWTRDILRRLSTLNVSAAEPLLLLGAVEATIDQEAELHGLLSAARIRGEWFRDDHKAVVEFIRLLPKVPGHPAHTRVRPLAHKSPKPLPEIDVLGPVMYWDLKNRLLIRAYTFMAMVGCSLTTVGLLAVKDGKFFSRLIRDGGKTCGIKNFDRVMGWFDENWPTQPEALAS